MLAATVRTTGLILGGIVERCWQPGAKKLSGRLLETVVHLVMPIAAFLTIVELKLTGAVCAGLAFGLAEPVVAVPAAWLLTTTILTLSRP